MAGKSSSGRLFEIASEWFLDYCICQLWKEFKKKRSFSECWEDAVQGNVEIYVLFSCVPLQIAVCFRGACLFSRRFQSMRINNKYNQ